MISAAEFSKSKRKLPSILKKKHKQQNSFTCVWIVQGGPFIFMGFVFVMKLKPFILDNMKWITFFSRCRKCICSYGGSTGGREILDMSEFIRKISPYKVRVKVEH
uniref:Uncharacterized protein n=1 Tax=Cacopsylla melanoneura TaxID=428564 RepID=A0A8D8SHS3_9HEMI